jgi:hypothetical protein
MSIEGYLTILEGAGELGVSEATMWNLVKGHELDRFRFPGNRRTYIKREDLEKLRLPMKLETPQRGRPRGSVQGKAAA